MLRIANNSKIIKNSDDTMNKNVCFNYTKEKDQIYWNNAVKKFISIISSLIDSIEVNALPESFLLSIEYVRVVPKTREIDGIFSGNSNCSIQSISSVPFNSIIDGDLVDVDQQRLIDHFEILSFPKLVEDINLIKNYLSNESLVSFSKSCIKGKNSLKSTKTTSNIINSNQLLKGLKANSLNYISSIDEVENITIIKKYNLDELNDSDASEFIMNENDVSLNGDKKTETFINELNSVNKNVSEFTVGIIDSKITNQFLDKFKNIIKYDDMTGDKNPYYSRVDKYSHAEMVASLVMFGDKINNNDDGCGLIKSHVFGVISDYGDNSTLSIISRIKKAVEMHHDKIKVWVMSLGIKEHKKTKTRLSYFGRVISNLELKYNIRFHISAGNPGEDNVILDPSDSPTSISVSSLSDMNGDIAEYSPKGYFGLLGTKPNFSYFGGSNNKKVNVLIYDEIDEGFLIYESKGTSLANPLVSRFYAKIFHTKGFESHEKVKLIMINASIKNTYNKSPEEMDDFITSEDKWKYGSGKLPTNLGLYDSSTFVNTFFKIKVKDLSYRNATTTNEIMIPSINGEKPYYLVISSIDGPENIDFSKGVKFNRVSTELLLSVKNENGKMKNLNKKDYKDKSTFNKINVYGAYWSEIEGAAIKEEQMLNNGKWISSTANIFDIDNLYKNSKINTDKFYLSINVSKRDKKDEVKNNQFIWISYDFIFKRELTLEEQNAFEKDLKTYHENEGHIVIRESIKVKVPAPTK